MQDFFLVKKLLFLIFYEIWHEIRHQISYENGYEIGYENKNWDKIMKFCSLVVKQIVGSL
jgi:hypothetical protein